jgi:hypothetical protein
MTDDLPPKRRRRGPALSRRRALCSATSGTKLWIADKLVLDEFVRRKRTTVAELLREIVHDWAIAKRVSGKTADNPETAGPIRKLHQQILSEQLAPVHSAVATIIDLLRPGSKVALSSDLDTTVARVSTQDGALLATLGRLHDEIKTTREQLAQLRAFATAHYMLDGQMFSVSWATLDFILRYIAEPLLRHDPTHTADSFQVALNHRDDARKEGLQMVEQMSLTFNYPEEYKLVLVDPPEGDF